MAFSLVEKTFLKLDTLCWSGFVVMTILQSTMAADTCLPDPQSPKSHNSCRCKTSSNKIIDLYKLVEGSESSTAFLYQAEGADGKGTYYYRPCLNFTIPGDATCKDVACCQKTKDTTAYFNLGIQSSAKFIGEPGTPSFALQYSAIDQSSGQTRTTTVKLICSNEKAEFSAAGEGKTLFYELTLKTKYACLESGGRLSTGSILLIVFFVLLIVYIVGGVLFLRYARGARGLEQIPNYTFWIDFPSLVKDGALFLFRGCKTESDNAYERI